ncbi:MAG: lipid IV(A) 3-deoxy-D-manno-octulosonic acid transferase [Pseudomonadales bacterium]
MARWCYTIVFYLITPLILLRLCYRATKASAYSKRIAERFGLFAAPELRDKLQDSIWVHSVSVGETIAVAPIVKRLQQQFPASRIVVTTMTPTGSERVRALFGDTVFHVYAPYDLPGSIKRFLKRVQPKLLVIMETELWPNTLHYCRKYTIPVVLANARLSAKSAAGYQRLSLLTKPVLGNLSTVVAQSQADADRFLSLGLAAEHIEVSGSIKFDIEISDELKEKASQLKFQWSLDGQRLIFLAASTHNGEDDIILQAFKAALNTHPQLLLVLVPRHPERFDQVVNLSQQFGFSTRRRSTGAALDMDTQVVIGDTMGELLLFYGCADIAFVGGSLVNTGGHNILEPAAWGLPIVIGESDFNFLEISRMLQQQGALTKVTDSDSLAQALLTLMNAEQKRIQMGAAALAVVTSNRGALDRLMSVINRYV